MWRAIPGAVARAAADPDVAALVLTGAGDHFSGGADIGEFAAVYGSAERRAAYNEAVRAATDAVAACPKPTVAAIRGACVGGGVSLAIACDLRLASDDARFAITPGKLGLVYNHADTSRLVRLVGVSRAKDLLFTGRLAEAAEAQSMGLVDRGAPAAAFDDALDGLLASLREMSRTSLRAMKRMAEAVAGGEPETAELAALFAESFASEDFGEGYRAFLEKRVPRFRAR
jgi:enoyl-CoA hydratase/carnithine racemase